MTIVVQNATWKVGIIYKKLPGSASPATTAALKTEQVV